MRRKLQRILRGKDRLLSAWMVSPYHCIKPPIVRGFQILHYWGTAAAQFFPPVPGNTEVLFHVLIKQAWLESNCMQPAEAATASSAEEELGKSMHSACEDRWAGLRLRYLVSALLLQSSWLTSWNTSISLCHSQTTFRWLPTNDQSQKSGQL